MTGMPTAAVGAALLVFLWVGLRARTADTTLNAYLTARGSQSALTLGLSFLASGLGLCNPFSVNFRVGGHDVRVTG